MLSSALFVVFASTIAWALATGHRGRPCGCFGSKGLPLGGKHLAFTAALSAMAFLAASIDGGGPAATLPETLVLVPMALLTALAAASLLGTAQALTASGET
jgi:hypothetical protein